MLTYLYQQFSPSVGTPILWNQPVSQRSQNANPEWTPESVSSSLHEHLSLTIQTENRRQSSQVHCSSTFQNFIPAMTNCNSNETGRQYQVETSDIVKVKKSRKRYTEDEKTGMREYHKNHPDVPYSKIGEVFGCSKSTAYRIINNIDAT
ncbi:MAG: hypothetical protein J3Q66DRAFT_405308 [Benniella sp.]|nr:MAG: hypothetical protein J3Q66DRAFT_405308 [Benniella sp.]